MIGASQGRPDDDHPLPPGPSDPVVRLALDKVQAFSQRAQHLRSYQAVYGPNPEPWKAQLAHILEHHPEALDAIGGGHGFGDEVSLNPQPLPPRYAFLAALVQSLVTRAELLQEMSDATARKGEQQGIIIVSGYVSRFSDDFCGTGFRLRWPLPGPQPNWFTQELDSIDLAVMATQFEDAAKQTASQDLRRSLAGAGSRFAETGMSRLNSAKRTVTVSLDTVTAVSCERGAGARTYNVVTTLAKRNRSTIEKRPLIARSGVQSGS